MTLKFLVLFKRIYKFHSTGVLVKDLHSLKHSSSFMLLNVRARLEPCMVKLLDLKGVPKRCKSLDIASNFHEFGVRIFTMRNNQK
jgi:hypothetical protein